MIFVRENAKEQPEKPRVVNSEQNPTGHLRNCRGELELVANHLGFKRGFFLPGIRPGKERNWAVTRGFQFACGSKF